MANEDLKKLRETMEGQEKHTRESWLKFLNPESLRSNLLVASLYLAAYEILRSSIIDQVKSFHTNGWTEAGDPFDAAYAKDVLSLNKSPLYASAQWLKQHDVIDAQDMTTLDRIRQHRNDLAHDLPKFVASADTEIDTGLFQSIIQLVSKIDRWWIIEVEIPTISDFDGKEIDIEGLQSGNMIFLSLLVQIATGKPENASVFYTGLKKHFETKKPAMR